MKFFLLFLIICSCGRKTVYVDPKLPPNKATSAEQDKLEEVLTEIQKDFDEAGVKVDLRSLPYVINELGGPYNNLMGQCFRKNNGKAIGIALDHEIFIPDTFPNPEGDYRDVHRVVLHEIGHCFFNREHDNDYFKVPGYDMNITYYPGRPSSKKDQFQQSIMNELGWYTIPKTIWPFFIKEVARKTRITHWEQIKEYVDVELVPAEAKN